MELIMIPESAHRRLPRSVKIKRRHTVQLTPVSRVRPHFVTVAPDEGLRMLTCVSIWKSQITPLEHQALQVSMWQSSRRRLTTVWETKNLCSWISLLWPISTLAQPL